MGVKNYFRVINLMKAAARGVILVTTIVFLNLFETLCWRFSQLSLVGSSDASNGFSYWFFTFAVY